MNISFAITSWESRVVEQLPDTWTVTDYRSLLALLEVSDLESIPEGELRDYTLLALTDLEQAEAAKLVLTYLLADVLTEGQIHNSAYELEEEPLWEEYPDINLHSAFFAAGELLYSAFPGKFPRPKARQIKLVITPGSPVAAKQLQQSKAIELLQMLLPGCSDQMLLKRLFGDQISSAESFPEAEGIIWKSEVKMLTPDSYEIKIISSDYWLDGFVAPPMFELSICFKEASLDISDK